MSLPIVDETATELLLGAGASPAAITHRRRVVAAYYHSVMGLSIDKAARLAGVTPGTLQTWKLRDDWDTIVGEAREDFRQELAAKARNRVLDTLDDPDHPESVKTARWALERVDEGMGGSVRGRSAAGGGVTIIFGAAPAGILRPDGPDSEGEITPSVVVETPQAVIPPGDTGTDAT